MTPWTKNDRPGGNRLAVLLLAAGLGAALPAMADRVDMRNGDRLTGKVVNKSDDVLVLRTDYAGDVKLRWADVATLVTEAPVKLALDDGTLVDLRLDAAEAGTVVSGVAGEDGEPRVVDLAAIRYINPTPAEAGVGYVFTGNARLATSRTRGNNTTDLFHADGDFSARAQTHRLNLQGQANHGRDDGVTLTSNWRVQGGYDRFYAAKDFLYARGTLERYRFKDIRRRSTVGAGFGHQVFENDTTSLALRGGLDYVNVDHFDAADEAYPAVGWGVELRHRLRFLGAEFFHTQDGTTGLSGEHKTILHTRTGLRLPLGYGVNASAQINVDWENQPAAGHKTTDTMSQLGLGYEFR